MSKSTRTHRSRKARAKPKALSTKALRTIIIDEVLIGTLEALADSEAHEFQRLILAGDYAGAAASAGRLLNIATVLRDE